MRSMPWRTESACSKTTRQGVTMKTERDSIETLMRLVMLADNLKTSNSFSQTSKLHESIVNLATNILEN